VLMVVAEADRPLVRPIVEAITRRDAEVVDEPSAADAAILIASPTAAVSDEVDRSLAAWTQRRPASDVLIVLVAGGLEWNTEEDAFDPTVTTALSARAQRLFATRPLWLDGRSGIEAPLAAKVAAAVVPTTPRTPAPAYAPTAGPPQAMPAEAPPRPRSRRTGVVVLAGLALVGLAAVAAMTLSLRSDQPAPPIDPSPPDASSPWPLLLGGIALGVVLALLVSWIYRRRRPIRSVPPRLVAGVPARPIVFISHDFDADHALAVRLAGDLRPDVDVWIAPESIEPGEPWLTSVERGLGLSQVVLALLSRASLASPWVIKEIQAAMELEVRQRLRLVPVQVEECDVPILLRTYQLMRLAAGYRAVVDQTRRLAARPPPR
jgi:TIR domain